MVKRVLLIGKTGVGKSSIVNNLAKQELALVSDFDTGTVEVSEYLININGHDLCLVDTIGYDHSVSVYDNKLQGTIDLILICVDVTVSRFDSDIKPTLLSIKKEIIIESSPFAIVYTKCNKENGITLKHKLDVYNNKIREIFEQLDSPIFFLKAYNNDYLADMELFKSKIIELLEIYKTPAQIDRDIKINACKIIIAIESIFNDNIYPKQIVDKFIEEYKQRVKNQKIEAIVKMIAGGILLVGGISILPFIPNLGTTATITASSLVASSGIGFGSILSYRGIKDNNNVKKDDDCKLNKTNKANVSNTSGQDLEAELYKLSYDLNNLLATEIEKQINDDIFENIEFRIGAYKYVGAIKNKKLLKGTLYKIIDGVSKKYIEIEADMRKFIDENYNLVNNILLS